MSTPPEATPLLPVSRQSLAPAAKSENSAVRRTVSMLQRYRDSHRKPDESGTDSGIDGVLRELECESERSARFIFLALIMFVSHILSGALLLSWLEGWPFIDSIYFCIVTTTTVGYGDITPKHPWSRVYVIFYVVFSIALFSTLLSYLIGLLIDQQEEILLSAIVRDDDMQNLLDSDSNNPAEPDQTDSSVTSTIIKATRRFHIDDYVSLFISCAWFFGVLIAGIVIFAFMEKLSVIDAVYTTIISASTVGFGDYSPTSGAAKLFICFWLLFSTTCVVKVIAEFTEASVRAKQRAVTRRLLTAQMDVATVKAMDRDGNKSVDKCEFVTELLVRSGKVDREEVDLMLMRFDQLDTSNTGEVTFEQVLGSKME